MKRTKIEVTVRTKWWTRLAGEALTTIGKLLPYRWQWRIWHWIRRNGLVVEEVR